MKNSIYYEMNKTKKGNRRLAKIEISRLNRNWNYGAPRKNNKTLFDMSKNIISDKVYTVKEAADTIGCSETEINRCFREFNLSREKIKNNWVMIGSEIIKAAELRNNAQKEVFPIEYKWRYLDMKFRCLDESDMKTINTTNIVDINEIKDSNLYLFKFKKEKYNVILSENYHVLCKDKGWVSVGDVLSCRVGESNIVAFNPASIAVNGKEWWRDVDWIISERDKGKTLREISKENNIKEKSLRTFSEKHKIRFQKIIDFPNETFEYKNKEWLISKKEIGWTNGRIAAECNTSEDRVKKSCKKLGVSGYIGVILSNGNRQKPWNTGLKYEMSDEVKKKKRDESKKFRENKIKNFKEETKHLEFNIARTEFMNMVRKDIYKRDGYRCAVSGLKNRLVAHHIDPVFNNPDETFNVDNLITLNRDVHTFIHKNNLEFVFKEWFDTGKDLTKFLDYDHGEISHVEIRKPTPKGSPLAIDFCDVVSVEYIGKGDSYNIQMENNNFFINGVLLKCRN